MKPSRSILAFAVLAFLYSFLLLGMSGSPGPVGSQVAPGPAYDAKIMDSESNAVQLTSVSIDGKTSFQAAMGKGKVTIPFEQISRIDIKGKNACVTLRNNQKMCNLVIRETSRVYGSTAYGIYQIALADVVWIELSKAK